MTPQEFKAWFDGFTEAMSGCPTKAQWGRIKERVAEIDGRAVTERVYLDRYWWGYHSHNHNPREWITYCSNTSNGVGVGSSALAQAGSNYQNSASFDSANAMYALGKNDAALVG